MRTRWPAPCSSWPARRCCASASRGPASSRPGSARGSTRWSASPAATGARWERAKPRGRRVQLEQLQRPPQLSPVLRRRKGPPRRRIAVALHDIEPATFERCALIRDWLDDHGVTRVTLLVIPARDMHPVGERAPAMVQWLCERGRRGDAIAQHGFHHARTARPARRRSPRGRDDAEFVGLDSGEARRALDAGWRVLKLAGIEPDGFVAPAYAYTPALRAALTPRYRWWASLLRVHRTR